MTLCRGWYRKPFKKRSGRRSERNDSPQKRRLNKLGSSPVLRVNSKNLTGTRT